PDELGQYRHHQHCYGNLRRRVWQCGDVAAINHKRSRLRAGDAKVRQPSALACEGNTMAKYRPPLHPDSPLYLNTHSRPVSRRELIAQGFKTGLGTVLGGSAFSLLSRPAFGQISLSTDL